MAHMANATGILLALSTSALSARADVKDEVLAASKAYDAAISAKDVAALGRLFDDDGHFVNEQGVVHDKGQHIADYANMKRTWNSAESSDIEITVLSDTVALETGTFLGAGTFNEKPIRLHSRYIDVWVKKAGRWVVAAEFATPIVSTSPDNADQSAADIGPPVLGVHDVELAAGIEPDEFERFVQERFVPAWREFRDGMRLVLTKGDRGQRKAKYQLVYVFDSVATRNRHFPENGEQAGAPSRAFEAAIEHVRELMQQLDKHLDEPTSSTDYVVMSELEEIE